MARHRERRARSARTATIEVSGATRHSVSRSTTVVPTRLGGSTTLDNLELRCRAHNTLAAEEDFGRKHMDRMRSVIDDAGLSFRLMAHRVATGPKP